MGRIEWPLPNGCQNIMRDLRETNFWKTIPQIHQLNNFLRTNISRLWKIEIMFPATFQGDVLSGTGRVADYTLENAWS